MAVTVLEGLKNAEYNLDTILQHHGHPLVILAMNQLHNGVALLNKGYSPETLIEPLLEEYGDIDNVPENK